jgi:hypothetical protein
VPSTEIADATQGVAKVLPASEQRQVTASSTPKPQSGSPMLTANASVFPAEWACERALAWGFFVTLAALLGRINSEIVKANLK